MERFAQPLDLVYMCHDLNECYFLYVIKWFGLVIFKLESNPNKLDTKFLNYKNTDMFESLKIIAVSDKSITKKN